MKQNQTSKYLLGPVANTFNSDKTGTWRIVRPVVDNEKCIRCGICLKHCPTDIITVPSKESQELLSFDFNYCKGCGICANVCPKTAISMVSEREAK